MRASVSRFEISAEMRAKGAQRERAQEMPTMPVRMMAWVGVRMKKVRSMQRKKRRWERSQARRRVSQGIWRRERRRVRRAWRVGEGVGAGVK